MSDKKLSWDDEIDRFEIIEKDLLSRKDFISIGGDSWRKYKNIYIPWMLHRIKELVSIIRKYEEDNK